MKESGHDTCFLLDRDTEKHKHDFGSVLTNASARMTLIVSKSSLSIRNKLQLRCCRVWMAILPSCDWLVMVNTNLWLAHWPVSCSCIRPVPGIPGLTMGQSEGQGVSVKVVYSAASIIDNNIRRIMQCQIRQRPDQPWPIPALSHLTRPMGDRVSSLSAASSDAIYELWWSDVNKWKTPGSVWPWIFNALERGGASLVSVTFGRLRGIGLQRVIKKYKNRYPDDMLSFRNQKL